MLFYIGWKSREGQGPDLAEAAWAVFKRWEAPEGFEVKGMWTRADGGGFAICEVTKAEALYEASAPWAGVYMDYDIIPLVEMERAGEIYEAAAAFRAG
jgi:hypothetical protein